MRFASNIIYSDEEDIISLPRNYAEIISLSNVQFDFWVETMAKSRDDLTLDDENVQEAASAVDDYYNVFNEICDLGFEEGETLSDPYGKNSIDLFRAEDGKGKKELIANNPTENYDGIYGSVAKEKEYFNASPKRKETKKYLNGSRPWEQQAEACGDNYIMGL